MSSTHLIAPTITKEVLRRFWKKVDVRGDDECWPWIGASHPEGYGRIWISPHNYAAHAVSRFIYSGVWPHGLLTLHKCDNPSCCNPFHLFLGTHADNMTDMVRKNRQARGDSIVLRRKSRKGCACPPSKLSEDDVLAIRSLYASGRWTQKALGEKFGVSQVQVGHVIRRKNWSWL